MAEPTQTMAIAGGFILTVLGVVKTSDKAEQVARAIWEVMENQRLASEQDARQKASARRTRLNTSWDQPAA